MWDALKSLRGNKEPSSQELRAALQGHDASTLEANVSQLAAERRQVIVEGGSDAEIAAVEKKLEQAERAVERGRIARGELEARLEQATAREASAALDAERLSAERAASELASRLASRWPLLQREMESLLKEIERVDQSVSAVNGKLMAAGRVDTVEETEWRVRPYPEFQLPSVVSISNNVVLPHVEEWKLEGYGAPLKLTSAFTYDPPTASWSSSS